MHNAMNEADLLCDTLLDQGIDTCFANPGTSDMHFVAALDRKPQTRCIPGTERASTPMLNVVDDHQRRG